MYKNFNLTESEREQILNHHKEYGYKKPLNEQAFDIEDEQEVSVEPDMSSDSGDDAMIDKLLNHFGFEKYKVLHDGDLVVYDNGDDTHNLEVRLFKYQGELMGKVLYHGPAFGKPNEMEDMVLTKENIPVKVGDNRFPMVLEKALKMVKSIKEYNSAPRLEEQSAGYVGDEQEVAPEDSSTGGFPISVRMAIMSHLSDLQEMNRDSKDEINFIKVLIRKYVPKDIEVDSDKLDALYDQVSSGDFSGSALEDSEMSEMNEQVSKLRGVEKGHYQGLSSVTGKKYWITVPKQEDGLLSAYGVVIPSDGPFDQYGQYKGKEDYVNLRYNEKDKTFLAGFEFKKKYGVFKLLSYFR